MVHESLCPAFLRSIKTSASLYPQPVASYECFLHRHCCHPQHLRSSFEILCPYLHSVPCHRRLQYDFQVLVLQARLFLSSVLLSILSVCLRRHRRRVGSTNPKLLIYHCSKKHIHPLELRCVQRHCVCSLLWPHRIVDTETP